jgi:hypothetical protein
MAPDRNFNICGAVSREERRDIAAAIADAKFPSRSEGVRTILLAFVHSEVARQAVDNYRAWQQEPGQ